MNAHCTWSDHHPDCATPVGFLGVGCDGEVSKFRTSHFSGAIPLFTIPVPQPEGRMASLEAQRDELFSVLKALCDELPAGSHLDTYHCAAQLSAARAVLAKVHGAPL